MVKVQDQVNKAYRVLLDKSLSVDDILGQNPDKTKYDEVYKAFTKKGKGIEWTNGSGVEKLLKHIEATPIAADSIKDRKQKDLLIEKTAAICLIVKEKTTSAIKGINKLKKTYPKFNEVVEKYNKYVRRNIEEPSLKAIFDYLSDTSTTKDNILTLKGAEKFEEAVNVHAGSALNISKIKLEAMIPYIDNEVSDVDTREELKAKLAAAFVITAEVKENTNKEITKIISPVVDGINSDSFQEVIDAEMRIPNGLVNASYKSNYQNLVNDLNLLSEQDRHVQRSRIDSFIASFAQHTNEQISKMEQKTDVGWKKRRLDSFSRLLNCGTACASVSFDGEDIKIAFNEVYQKSPEILAVAATDTISEVKAKRAKINGFAGDLKTQTERVMEYLQKYSNAPDQIEFIKEQDNKKKSQNIIVNGAAYYNVSVMDGKGKAEELEESRDKNGRYDSINISKLYATATTNLPIPIVGDRYTEEARNSYNKGIGKDLQSVARMKVDLAKLRGALANNAESGDKRFDQDLKVAFRKGFKREQNLVGAGSHNEQYHAEVRQMRYYQDLVKQYQDRKSDSAFYAFANVYAFANEYEKYLDEDPSRKASSKEYGNFLTKKSSDLTDIDAKDQSLIRKISYLRREGAYIGISKLCCTECSLVLNQEDKLKLQIEVNGKTQTIDIETMGGSHGHSYRWSAIDTISEDKEMLKSFLGDKA